MIGLDWQADRKPLDRAVAPVDSLGITGVVGPLEIILYASRNDAFPESGEPHFNPACVENKSVATRSTRQQTGLFVPFALF